MTRLVTLCGGNPRTIVIEAVGQGLREIILDRVGGSCSGG